MNKVCKKCSRELPNNYKHKYCENCRNMQIKAIKNAGATALSLAVLVGGTAITIITNGKINPKK